MNGMTELLQMITWLSLQFTREILREASRSGKTVEQLLKEAEDQTKANTAAIAALRAKLEAMDPDD